MRTLLAALACLPGSLVFGEISIATVIVGNPGNIDDEIFFGAIGLGYGGVAYTYHIGTYEVTNSQYAAFLNAAAKSDPTGLHHPGMQIMRSGVDGSYAYAVNAGFDDKPVVFVGFWDCLRFANWLTNGQGEGSTETGVYDLTDAEAVASNSVERNLAAWEAGGVALASRGEWHKAAYHQPASDGGDPANYWNFATRTNAIDTTQANYANSVGSLTDVGSYPGFPSYYGTFDQNGNVQEWTEGRIGFDEREVRGGHAGSQPQFLQAASYDDFPPNNDFFEFDNLGFRVTSLNPIGGGVVTPGPIRLSIRRVSSERVLLTVEGTSGTEWELYFATDLESPEWALRTTLTLADSPFEFEDSLEQGRGFYQLKAPAGP